LATTVRRGLEQDGHDVIVASRRGPATLDAIDGADVVINLAGRSVNCRYNERNRREILESRVNSTRAAAEAICRAARPPKLWLQASTATIYAHTYEAPNDENGTLGRSQPDAPDT